MDVSVSEAKGVLLDLVRRAEAGEDVTLTRYGVPVVRLVAATARPLPAERLARLREMIGVGRNSAGADAARSQDFLYDEAGLPR